jgi:hypothetical protein
VDCERLQAQSEKAVLELALYTKKNARSQSLQEHKLQCEQERAAGLELELEQTNAGKLILQQERKKGESILTPCS